MDTTIWDFETIRAHIVAGLPLVEMFGLEVVQADAGSSRIRLNAFANVVRPGGSVAGPILFAAADVATYALILATRGDPHAVTVDLTMNFLRASRSLPIVAEARTLRAGRRLFTADIRIAPEADPVRLVASASATYALTS